MRGGVWPPELVGRLVLALAALLSVGWIPGKLQCCSSAGSYYEIGPISGDVSKGIEGESGPLVKKVDILSIPQFQAS
jgi:hypothetical protein